MLPFFRPGGGNLHYYTPLLENDRRTREKTLLSAAIITFYLQAPFRFPATSKGTENFGPIQEREALLIDT